MPNYIQFINSGRVEAWTATSEYQSDWYYLEVPLSGVERGGGFQPATVEQETGFYLFASNQVQTVIGSISFPQNVDLNGNFIPLVKWTKTSSASGGVQWNYLYKTTFPGQTIPASYIDLGYGIETANFKNDDTADKFAIDIWDTKEIDPAANEEPLGAVITMQLNRDVNAAGDTYGTNARMMSFGILLQIDTLGSEEPLVK